MEYIVHGSKNQYDRLKLLTISMLCGQHHLVDV